jgi:hypothetical protein
VVIRPQFNQNQTLLKKKSMAKPKRQTISIRKTPRPKRTSIGKSKNSRPKNKNKRGNWKKYRGQGT